MDFSKRYYTPEERAAAITEALACYNTAEEPWLIARSDEELVQTIKAAMPLAPPEISESRPLTKTEDNEIQFEVDSQMFGGKYAPVEIPTWYRETHEREQRASFEKLVAPGIRAQNALDGMIEKAVTEAFAKLTKRAGTRSEVVPGHAIPVRETPVREGIMPALAARASEDAPN